MEKNHNSPSPFVLVFIYISFHFSFLLELMCSWILCGSSFFFLLHFASRPKLNSSGWKHKFHFHYVFFFFPFLKGTIIGLISCALCQFVHANCNPYFTFWVSFFTIWSPIFFLLSSTQRDGKLLWNLHLHLLVINRIWCSSSVIGNLIVILFSICSSMCVCLIFF